RIVVEKRWIRVGLVHAIGRGRDGVGQPDRIRDIVGRARRRQTTIRYGDDRGRREECTAEGERRRGERAVVVARVHSDRTSAADDRVRKRLPRRVVVVGGQRD